MSTPTEPETTPPPVDRPNPIPPSFANNPYAKDYLSNPYGAMSSKHPADLPVGIVIVVFSGLGILGFLALLGLGGVAGGLGAHALGGFFMILAVIGLASAVGNIIGAVGIIKGMRWGFMLVGALAILGIICNLAIGVVNILGIVIGAVEVVYCGMRITGQLGNKAG